jgi:hypothetical protein
MDVGANEWATVSGHEDGAAEAVVAVGEGDGGSTNQ